MHGFDPPFHTVHKIILCFQMELFFVIAGYVSFLSKGSITLNSFGKKAKRLLMLYLTWVTIALVIGLFKGTVHFDFLTIGRFYLQHPFWFLRTMFYACAIHMMARKVYTLNVLKRSFVVRAIASAMTVLALSVFVRYILCDGALPRYLAWVYVGFGVGPFIRLDSETKQYPLFGRFMALLGRQSLALYALHWWLFFVMVMLPIPTWPRCPEILYAMVVSLVWLFASLCLDLILSRVSILSQMLFGNDKRIKC